MSGGWGICPPCARPAYLVRWGFLRLDLAGVFRCRRFQPDFLPYLVAAVAKYSDTGCILLYRVPDSIHQNPDICIPQRPYSSVGLPMYRFGAGVPMISGSTRGATLESNFPSVFLCTAFHFAFKLTVLGSSQQGLNNSLPTVFVRVFRFLSGIVVDTHYNKLFRANKEPGPSTEIVSCRVTCNTIKCLQHLRCWQW